MNGWPAYKMARDLASGNVFPVSEAVILQTVFVRPAWQAKSPLSADAERT